MRKISLGRSGIVVSAVGLGGIQFSKISAQAVARAVHAALDEGITFLETAYGYSDSEARIGRSLGGRREQVVLASKSSAADGRTFTDHLEESLRRLRTDWIDIYQLHGVDTEAGLARATSVRGPVTAAAKAIRQGKLRSLGISSHSLDVSMKALDLDLFDSLQYPISLINTEVVRSGLLRKARAHRTGLIAMKPLGGGRLGNARLALGYIYRYRGVVPVVGVETPEQVRELARLGRRPPKLRPVDSEAIRRIRKTVGKTFCRACRYCEPCPQGISIYRALYLPVYLSQVGAKRVLRSSLPNWLAKAEECTECRQCESRCPFHLRIVSGLRSSLELARAHLAKGRQARRDHRAP